MAKKRRSAKGLPASKKFGKKIYKKVLCSSTKTNASKKAKSIRAAGGTARVVKDPVTKKHCVFRGSKRK